MNTTRNILLLFILCIASVSFIYSQNNETNKPKRSSNLKPVTETEYFIRQQNLRQTTESQHTAPRQEMTKRIQQTTPLQQEQKTVDVHQQMQETESNTLHQPVIQKSEIHNNRSDDKASVFILAVLIVAILNFIGFYLYKKWKEFNQLQSKPKTLIIPPKTTVPDIYPIEVENKINQVADDSLQDRLEAEETVITETQPTGEAELALALRELKSKYQVQEIEKIVKKRSSKKQTPKEAKKLGTGIGEIELANRLEQMKRTYQKKEQQ